MKTCPFKSIWLLALGLLLSLTACKEEVLDEYPQIISMSIPGIPPENITTDQQQRRIIVVLPPTLPSLELVPSFDLSRQAYLSPYWTKNQPVAFSLASYCACQYNGRSTASLQSYARVDNQKHATEYTVQFKGNGIPLRIKALDAPVVYDTQTNNIIYFPVENQYGSAYVHYISVTPTGSATLKWIGVSDICFDMCEGRLNQLGIPLGGYLVGGLGGAPQFSSLKPGLHDLDLWLADGTKIHAEGYILVK